MSSELLLKVTSFLRKTTRRYNKITVFLNCKTFFIPLLTIRDLIAVRVKEKSTIDVIFRIQNTRNYIKYVNCN